MTIDIEVNGTSRTIGSAEGTPLLYVLRNELGLKGTRFGCGEGTCGTCTVLIDGVARHSCDLPVEYVGTGKITTIEGLAASSSVSPLQQAFIAEQAAQCGFCSSGILLRARALLDETPQPTEAEIREGLDENLCRCGSHQRVVRAVMRTVSEDLDHSLHQAEVRLASSSDASEEPRFGNQYLSVRADGTVHVTLGKVDIGQGISTALGQIAAGELDVDIQRIRLAVADTATSPDEGHTSGSWSIEKGGANLRQAAAGLRAELLAAAGEELNETPRNLKISDGEISAPDGRSVTFWALAGGAAHPQQSSSADQVAGAVGTSIPRWDLSRKFRGEASFVHDLELPGMVHGRVVRAPSGRARLTHLDDTRAASAPGVVKIVRSGSFIGVIAAEEYQAVQASDLLMGGAEWDYSPSVSRDLADARHLLSEEVQTDVVHNHEGAAPGGTRRSFTAEYTRPFLAHAAMGPSCAVALHEGDTFTVWSHTQGVFPLRREIARVLELAEPAVRVIHMEGPGCYGHNGADDAALDAVLLAKEMPGRPVRVMWSRADEFLWEPFGSAMVVQLEGALDGAGNITTWGSDVWSYVHTNRPGMGFGFPVEAHLEGRSGPPRPDPLPVASAVRNAVPIYDIPNVEVRGHVARTNHVRTSALRSLGAHANVFAIESLIDEMADEIDESPVSFRLRHLVDTRARDVVQAVAELSGGPIGGTNEAGNGFGLGLARYKGEGGYAAIVAEIEAETEVRVVRVWAVVDAGLIVNPDGAINQIEGGIIQSASWALKESVGFMDGLPQPRGWEDYPILTFTEVPDITVELINRPEEASTGVGEVAQGPTTAAIANGLRAVLGVPIRDLPFSADRIVKALL